MFRLLILTFFGKARYTHDDVHHVHESPASMLIPLVVLAIGSIGGGLPERSRHFWDFNPPKQAGR